MKLVLTSAPCRIHRTRQTCRNCLLNLVNATCLQVGGCFWDLIIWIINAPKIAIQESLFSSVLELQKKNSKIHSHFFLQKSIKKNFTLPSWKHKFSGVGSGIRRPVTIKNSSYSCQQRVIGAASYFDRNKEELRHVRLLDTTEDCDLHKDLRQHYPNKYWIVWVAAPKYANKTCKRRRQTSQ